MNIFDLQQPYICTNEELISCGDQYTRFRGLHGKRPLAEENCSLSYKPHRMSRYKTRACSGQNDVMTETCNDIG